ncbi:UvrD-helicase domain-containing protein [Lysobacter sp. ESA13C]|uniref:UvrD-helicase domain-containing protein n=1 Tax=Lysobacter sp. ESA13C TaxID=2862676 RepID=UPI001CC14F25|nr:UvrD-helicase domain-containing protein [Lysobacter sp. ESA13C]
MIRIPELTPELLDELGKSLGGCTFDDENQIRFLRTVDSCEVQAAPGNGKTTLLIAKLALLSRTWTSRVQGVCVISHTNAARDEVEKALLGHAAASVFLGYPHFIGTVTAFLHQYLAMPYLRGLGWSVERIDDDAFAAAAKRAMRGKASLVKRTKQRKGMFARQTETWASNLELADDFTCMAGQPPDRLKVRALRGQHGPSTDCGSDLESLKTELVNQGIYRFGDLVALAKKALDLSPNLADRVRRRFPLVLLDEAQDTSGSQLKILNTLFGNGGAAYQRLGDRNQTLYEGFAEEDTLWAPAAAVIPLNRTRRFGSEIAAFASSLTTRHRQQIQGEPGLPCRRTLLLFDQASIDRVHPAYVEEIQTHWPNPPGPPAALWAVASRHSSYRPRGAWLPKSLVDYYPSYRADSSSSAQAETLCRMMQKASLLHAGGGQPRASLAFAESALVRYLRLYGCTAENGGRIHNANLWRIPLFSEDRCRSLAVRRLFRDSILMGTSAWAKNEWESFCERLKTCLGLGDASGDKDALKLFLEFEDREAMTASTPTQSAKLAQIDGLSVHLGSIHSVKGRTVDAVLLVESEIWKGNKTEDKCMDLETILPHAFGIEECDFSGNDAHLTAATNAFVGVTRGRQVLALAVRRSAVSVQLLAAARDQGWIVRDLTLAPAS